MEYLSWLFFCLSPFALFCSEDGTGLLLFPVFIAIGFAFRWAAKNIGSSSTVVVKIEPQNFWEWHYKDRMSSTLAQKDSINDRLMAHRDKEARSWATTICGYHNAPVPSEAKQEQIARSNGVITDKMVKENEIKKDRIQIGKYFLMRELKLKYDSPKTRDERREIEEDMRRIKMSRYGDGADDWYVKRKYQKTVSEVWATLSLNERKEAEQWIKEYEEKLIATIQDYKENKRFKVTPVKIDFE